MKQPLLEAVWPSCTDFSHVDQLDETVPYRAAAYPADSALGDQPNSWYLHNLHTNSRVPSSDPAPNLVNNIQSIGLAS